MVGRNGVRRQKLKRYYPKDGAGRKLANFVELQSLDMALSTGGRDTFIDDTYRR